MEINQEAPKRLGRPASRVGAPEIMRPSSPKIQWRARNADAAAGMGKYDIPEEVIPDGMDWQYKRVSYAGKEDITHQMGMMRDGAWDPVPHEAWPERLGKFGVPGQAIVIDGLMLMQRPMQYTVEAMAEEKKAAKDRVSNQMAELGLSNTALPRAKPKIKTRYETLTVPNDDETE